MKPCLRLLQSERLRKIPPLHPLHRWIRWIPRSFSSLKLSYLAFSLFGSMCRSEPGHWSLHVLDSNYVRQPLLTYLLTYLLNEMLWTNQTTMNRCEFDMTSIWLHGSWRQELKNSCGVGLRPSESATHKATKAVVSSWRTRCCTPFSVQMLQSSAVCSRKRGVSSKPLIAGHRRHQCRWAVWKVEERDFSWLSWLWPFQSEEKPDQKAPWGKSRNCNSGPLRQQVTMKP